MKLRPPSEIARDISSVMQSEHECRSVLRQLRMALEGNYLGDNYDPLVGELYHSITTVYQQQISKK